MSSIRAARRLLIAGPRATILHHPPIITHRPPATPRCLLLQGSSQNYNSSSPRQKSAKRDEHSDDSRDHSSSISTQFEKKATTRSTASKSNLRRVAAKERKNAPSTGNDESKPPTQICTAYCTAEKYNLRLSNSLLKAGGYVPDPLSTGLGDEVIHLRLLLPPQARRHFPNSSADTYGDIFIFPSGNIVSWGLPEAIITSVAALIRPAAESSHSTTETETLEFVEDPNRSSSFLRGDVIIIGTGRKPEEEHLTTTHIGIGSISTGSEALAVPHDEEESSRRQATPIVLAKIAFSSGLARSTKLAVLEETLQSYIESTSHIPVLLSQGSRLPFTRNFILRKTGELLSFRARLNLYSELTDNLPDIFWDSRRELGLEGYYESVGRELDVGVRIRQLNEKLDYASEMAAVLRERLSERHGLVLEWMIIILITIEVGFEILHLWKDSKAEQKWEERELDAEVDAQVNGPSYPRHVYQPAPLPPNQGYHPHEYHQHHQHLYPPPYRPHPTYMPSHPQPQYLQIPDQDRKMSDIDRALALLDGIIAEEERRQKEKKQN
ncbi:hypothetical protein ABW19_dt0205078 [Dactylella cylindrospora]|nr:hypothetical protein ABW19_dt0205078 [Dactylella cylindrospora]